MKLQTQTRAGYALGTEEVEYAPCRERIPVANGRWLVPVAERPANWRDILPEGK